MNLEVSMNNGTLLINGRHLGPDDLKNLCSSVAAASPMILRTLVEESRDSVRFAQIVSGPEQILANSRRIPISELTARSRWSWLIRILRIGGLDGDLGIVSGESEMDGLWLLAKPPPRYQEDEILYLTHPFGSIDPVMVLGPPPADVKTDLEKGLWSYKESGQLAIGESNYGHGNAVLGVYCTRDPDHLNSMMHGWTRLVGQRYDGVPDLRY